MSISRMKIHDLLHDNSDHECEGLGPDKIWKALAYLETLPRSDEPGVGAPEAGSPEAAGDAAAAASGG